MKRKVSDQQPSLWGGLEVAGEEISSPARQVITFPVKKAVSQQNEDGSIKAHYARTDRGCSLPISSCMYCHQWAWILVLDEKKYRCLICEPQLRESFRAWMMTWGKRHGYPAFSFLTGSGYAGDFRTFAIVAGEENWSVFGGVAAETLGKAQHAMLMEDVKADGWCAARPCALGWEVLKGDEVVATWPVKGRDAGRIEDSAKGYAASWNSPCGRLWRFGRIGEWHVVRDLVRVPVQLVPPMTLDEVQVRLMELGELCGYPALGFVWDNERIVYRLPQGEAGYQERAKLASHLWLWHAVCALELVKEDMHE